MRKAPSRRRFISILAAAAGFELAARTPLRAQPDAFAWRGQLMGAEASLRIHHHDAAVARRLIERSIEEVRRLERIFSLYREDSAIVALNRTGVLAAPPADLVTLLETARDMHARTQGAFDPTMQPLWALYRDHFSRADADASGPLAPALERALQRVGLRHVAFDRNRVALLRPGMALTFNGIAQGYATDRVVDILRDAGIERSLVDMGEPRAIGTAPHAGPWRIGIADPDDPGRLGDAIEVVDRAVATSGAYGFRFDRAGRFNHLVDPRTGAPATRYRSVTVILPDATRADALSTAFNLMTPEEIRAAIGTLGAGEARFLTAAGERGVVAA